jgi:hypothetical protein
MKKLKAKSLARISSIILWLAATTTPAAHAGPEVVAWGYNEDGQLPGTFRTVPSGLSNVVAIAAGYVHSVALVQQPKVPMPKLELSRGTSELSLRAHGAPGISCQLLRASELLGPWLPAEPVTFTNHMQWLCPPDASAPAQFFRLLRK